MTATTLTAGRESAAGARLRRIAGRLKLLIGLLAIYGPIAVVVLAHRHLEGAVYLVLAAWAAEGMCWYAFDQCFGAARRSRAGRPG